MAEEEILIKFRADTKDLEASANKAATATKKVETAAKGANETIKAQIGIVGNLNKRIEQLKVARDASFDPKKIKRFNKIIKESEQRVNKLTDTTNELTKATKKTAKSTSKFGTIAKGVFAGLGAAFAITKIVQFGKSVINTISEFEQAIANLGAITGTSGAELEKFKDKVLDVSAQTGKGATEIAKAFQLVGSAKPELLGNADALAEVSKQAVILSQAGGVDLVIAAHALTKSMNQFGASADQAGLFTDILATSQQKGTATISELSESLKNVGAVAADAGLTFEDTNVALQGLAKGGLVGAEAGTGLRAVLLRLQKAGLGFVDGQFDLIAAIKQSKEKFDEIKDPIEKVKQATALFGEENIKTGKTLITQIDQLEILDGKLNQTGAAQEQATQRQATLRGQTEELNSAFERFILSIEDGDGALSNILIAIAGTAKEVLTLLSGTEELESELDDGEKKVRSFAKTFISLVKGIAITIATFKAYQLAMKLGLAIQKGLTIATTAFTFVQTALRDGLKAARAAQLAFNAAANANPIGLFIVVVAAFTAAIFAFATRTDEATLAQNAFNDAQERALRIAKKRITSLNEIREAQLKTIRDEVALRKAQGGDEDKLNKESINRQNEVLEAEIVSNNKRKENLANITKERVAIIEKELAEVTKLQNETRVAGTAAQNGVLQLRREALVKQRGVEIGNATGIKKALDENNKEILAQQKQNNQDLAVLGAEAATSAIETNKKLTEKQKKEAEKAAKEKLAAFLKQQQDLLTALEGEETVRIALIKDEEEKELILSAQKFDKLFEQANNNAELENKLIIAQEEEAEEIRKKFTDKRIKSLEEESNKLIEKQDALDNARIEAIPDVIERETEAALKANAEKFDKLFKDAESDSKLQTELIQRQADETIKIEEEAAQKRSDIDQQLLEEKIEKLLEFTDFVKNTIEGLDQIQQSLTVAELARFDEAENKKLAAAKGNEELQAKIKEDGERKRLEIEKKAFKVRQALSIAIIAVNLAEAIAGVVKASANNPLNAVTFGAAGAIQAAIGIAGVVAEFAVQKANASAVKFVAGEIDIQGKGTATSDSIPAMISKGESVMTAEETKKHKDALLAIRNDKYDQFINDRYIQPLLSESIKEYEQGFAGNVMNSVNYNFNDRKITKHQKVHTTLLEALNMQVNNLNRNLSKPKGYGGEL